MSELAKLFNRHDCDKSRKHRYEQVYEPHFEPRRNDEINLLEIGTFKAASTKAFRDYFPNANIYTIDIFQRTRPENLPILNDEKVHWLKADTTIATLPQLMRDEFGANLKFNFIIDDGAHWPMANLLTFRNCFPFLTEDGTYFIEDVWPLELMSFQQLRHPWLLSRQERYSQLDNNQFVEEINKHTVVRHDLRKTSGQPDSYIIAVSNQ